MLIIVKITYFYSVHKNQYPYQSDEELLHHYQKSHDEEVLGLLIERYLHLIFGMCMKYLKNEAEAKDQVQQICIKVVRELRRTDIHYFKSWLYQVTKNHCLMHLRKVKHQTLPIDATREPPAEPSGEKAGFIKKEQQYDSLDQALTELNEDQRYCIQMFYFDKKTYQEIADEKEYSLKQVKSHIQNGRRNLKVFMEKNTPS